jgi:hypothetical protein
LPDGKKRGRLCRRRRNLREPVYRRRNLTKVLREKIDSHFQANTNYRSEKPLNRQFDLLNLSQKDSEHNEFAEEYKKK